MSNLPANWQNNLVFETVDQINKDLSFVQKTIDRPLTQEDSYDYLVLALASILDNLSTQQIQSLMYKVDISEIKFRALINLKFSKSMHYQKLSEMIIEREFKKVYVRRMLSR